MNVLATAAHVKKVYAVAVSMKTLMLFVAQYSTAPRAIEANSTIQFSSSVPANQILSACQ